MNLSSVGVISLVVVVVVDALKDQFPKLTGNVTRLVALVVGGVLGYGASVGYLPLAGMDIVTGAVAGAIAAGGISVVNKVGNE